MNAADVVAAREHLSPEARRERYLQFARVVVERGFAALDPEQVHLGVSWLYDLILTDEDGPQLEVVLDNCGLTEGELAQLFRRPDKDELL
jgi:hypothetical protein